jgi:hypothetical protein
MKTILLFVYLSSLLVSAIMALANRSALKSRLLFLLAPFLVYVFLQELGIYLYLLQWPKSSTGVFYNIYNPINTTVFCILYYRIPFNRWSRKWIVIMLAIYLSAIIITLAFLQPITKLNFYLSLGGGFVIICCGILFLRSYFDLDNLREEKYWRPLLWITVAVVMFYTVVNISWAFHKSLLANSATLGGFKLYQLIPQVMSIFMYSCFTYAFYLCRKRN